MPNPTLVHLPDNFGRFEVYTQAMVGFGNYTRVNVPYFPCAVEFMEKTFLSEEDKQLFGNTTALCLDFESIEIFGDRLLTNG